MYDRLNANIYIAIEFIGNVLKRIYIIGFFRHKRVRRSQVSVSGKQEGKWEEVALKQQEIMYFFNINWNVIIM
jgi:hypothetical protein